MRISDWSSDVCSSDLLLGRQRVRFQPASDLHFQMKQRQPFHSNALSFTARDGDGEILAKRMYFSIGGGFVVDEVEAGSNSRGAEDELELPFAIPSGADLLNMTPAPRKSFAHLHLHNVLPPRRSARADGRLDCLACPCY